MKTGRSFVQARRTTSPLGPRRRRAVRARPPVAAKIPTPAAASAGACPPRPLAGTHRTLKQPYLSARGLSILVHLLAGALVLLLYVVVERTLEEPIPALIVTAVLATWIVSIGATAPGGGPRRR
ncbi:MAG: hypothetical protein JO013_06905 [Alphaproteobacteria bacterium]|nr:hypothetical protein [Alphaproteobacteria bacterium]